jgi:hypothetical protein
MAVSEPGRATTRRYPAVFIAIAIWHFPSAYSQPTVSVPFVRCNSDGQVGPIEAPVEVEKRIPIDPEIAQRLAYYEAGVAPGLLGPRGWSCFGIYGSGGSSLFITPEPIESAPFPLREFTGPVIKIDSTSGDTSGRFEVAQVVARVFPKHRAFVQGVIDMFDFFASQVTYGPYPSDKLIYRSERVVEYVTPPNTEGLGTVTSYVKQNNESIEGVAILQEPTPDLLLLSVRLPPDLKVLTSQIIREVERQASSQPAR